MASTRAISVGADGRPRRTPHVGVSWTRRTWADRSVRAPLGSAAGVPEITVEPVTRDTPEAS
ncbi:hypothetical protein EGT67_02175 [Prescottella agglutinans]|uniref:Uncharacterized protein n=1 Tax=Prescottella agglutinans TaxID=1644129 RepID=A0A3S3ZYR7_9NOCA|nr:hypothetical protein EGT67_02175 [Prescottella agglutinans]